MNRPVQMLFQEPPGFRKFEIGGIRAFSFGTTVNPRDEIVARVDKLSLPSYTGFVMPKLTPVTNANGEVTDINISYPKDLTAQMLEYSAQSQATSQITNH